MSHSLNKQIMVVGGDTHFTYLMQRFIRTSAHHMVSATLTEDVLYRVRCENPAAIILHVDQPDTPGWNTLRALKSDPEFAKIPVIVCSWLDGETHSWEQGADYYLRMPILYADFETALAVTLEKYIHNKGTI